MPFTYHVAEHDGGYAYHVGEVWSETFPDHDSALKAAKLAAQRQQLGGDDAEISYQLPDGRWQTEHAGGWLPSQIGSRLWRWISCYRGSSAAPCAYVREETVAGYFWINPAVDTGGGVRIRCAVRPLG